MRARSHRASEVEPSIACIIAKVTSSASPSCGESFSRSSVCGREGVQLCLHAVTLDSLGSPVNWPCSPVMTLFASSAGLSQMSE